MHEHYEISPLPTENMMVMHSKPLLEFRRQPGLTNPIWHKLHTYNGHKPLMSRPAALLPSLPSGTSSSSSTSAAAETDTRSTESGRRVQ